MSKSHSHNPFVRFLKALVLQVWSLDPQEQPHLGTDKKPTEMLHSFLDWLSKIILVGPNSLHFTESSIYNFNTALIWELFPCNHYEFPNLFRDGKGRMHGSPCTIKNVDCTSTSPHACWNVHPVLRIWIVITWQLMSMVWPEGQSLAEDRDHFGFWLRDMEPCRTSLTVK